MSTASIDRIDPVLPLVFDFCVPFVDLCLSSPRQRSQCPCDMKMGLTPLRLSCVNRRWRDIVINTSELWTRSDLGQAPEDPALIEVFTKRSNGRLQDVYSVCIHDRKLVDKLRFLISCISNVRHIVIIFDNRFHSSSISLHEAMGSELLPQTGEAVLDRLLSFTFCPFEAAWEGLPSTLQTYCYELEWAFEIANRAPNLRNLVIGPTRKPCQWWSFQHKPIEGIAWKLTGLFLEGDMPIESLLELLYFSRSTLVKLRAGLCLESRCGPQLKVPSHLNRFSLPMIEEIEVNSGDDTLCGLWHLYQRIDSAPHITRPQILKLTCKCEQPNEEHPEGPLEKHIKLLQLLDCIPCNVSELMLDGWHINEEWIMEYLTHDKVKNTLRHLRIDGDEDLLLPRSDESSEFLGHRFLDYLQESFDNMDHLELTQCLDPHLKDGSFSRAIELWLDRTDSIRADKDKPEGLPRPPLFLDVLMISVEERATGEEESEENLEKQITAYVQGRVERPADVDRDLLEDGILLNQLLAMGRIRMGGSIHSISPYLADRLSNYRPGRVLL